MTNSLHPERKNLDQILRLAFGLCAFSIVMPMRVNSLLMFSVSIGFIVYAFARNSFSKEIFQSQLIRLITIAFLIQCVGLVYSQNKNAGLSDLERSGFAFLFPTVFFLTQKSRLNVALLITCLGLGCAAVTLYGFIYSVFLLDSFDRTTVFQFGHTYFTDIISIHPTYFSIYLMFVFFFLLEFVRSRWNELSTTKKIFAAIGLIVMVGMLLFLRSQMELVIFGLLNVLYVIVIFKRRAWFVTFILFALGLIIFLLDRDRVTTLFDTYGRNVSTAVDNRFKVWNGALEAIKTAPVFGAGTGGEQMALNEAYLKTDYKEGIEKSYNAHNQYLEFWVRNGIFELGVFMALLIYSFRQSLKSNNYTFLMFNMIFSLSMLTESCLNVQRGVVFFYFFLSAFIFLPFDSASEKPTTQL
jgi:O-antigen ligase